ncbi:MAG: phosphoribosylformylglycinamidine synthase, partial [Gemmataceae bacterium]
MLWEVELRPNGRDADRERVCDEFDLITGSVRGGDLVAAASRGFLLEGERLARPDVERLAGELLADPVVESVAVAELGGRHDGNAYTVLLKPGVMDPTAESVLKAAADLNVPAAEVRTFRRYYGPGGISGLDRDTLFRKVLANDAIEQVVIGPLRADHLAIGRPYSFQLVTVPLRNLDDAGLMKVSKDGTLALTVEEMRQIQAHFRDQGRDPTDAELESIAQTWSEHCSHKTLKGEVEYTETIGGKTTVKRFKNLLKETVFAATVQVRKNLGD